MYDFPGADFFEILGSLEVVQMFADNWSLAVVVLIVAFVVGVTVQNLIVQKLGLNSWNGRNGLFVIVGSVSGVDQWSYESFGHGRLYQVLIQTETDLNIRNALGNDSRYSWIN